MLFIGAAVFGFIGFLTMFSGQDDGVTHDPRAFWFAVGLWAASGLFTLVGGVLDWIDDRDERRHARDGDSGDADVHAVL